MVRNSKEWVVCGLFVGLVALTGCGGSDEEGTTDPDASPSDVADGQGGGDAEPDATEPDADTAEPDIAAPDTDDQPDAEPDADAGAQDVGPDVDAQAPDVAVSDAIEDVVPDVDTTLPDAGDDTTPDVADVTPDIVEDVVPDTLTDVTPDIVEDVVPDAVADVTPDVVEDVVPDVEPDTFDAGPDVDEDADVVVDLCATVRCARSENPCELIACDPATGECVPGPADDGQPCARPTDCRGASVCQSGECVPGAAFEDGTACTPLSESACSLEPTCQEGSCAGVAYGCMADGLETGALVDAGTRLGWESSAFAPELSCRSRFVLSAIRPLYSAEFVAGWQGTCLFPTVATPESEPTLDVSLFLPETAGGGVPDPVTLPGDVECPSGHAVVGLSWLPSLTFGAPQQVKVVCAPFSLVDERPEGFSFVVGDPIEPSYDATVAPGVQTVRCAADEVVQAVRVASSNRIEVACANPVPLLARSGPGAPTSPGPLDPVQLCPYGAGLVGFRGELAVDFYNGHTTRATVLCRDYQINPFGDGGGTVTWGAEFPASPLVLGAVEGDPPISAICPENTWVYGGLISGGDVGTGGPLLTGASLRCAPVTLEASALDDSAYRLVPDTAASTDVFWGQDLTETTIDNVCPEGESVVGVWAYSGEIWDNAALMCSPRYP